MLPEKNCRQVAAVHHRFGSGTPSSSGVYGAPTISEIPTRATYARLCGRDSRESRECWLLRRQGGTIETRKRLRRTGSWRAAHAFLSLNARRRDFHRTAVEDTIDVVIKLKYVWWTFETLGETKSATSTTQPSYWGSRGQGGTAPIIR